MTALLAVHGVIWWQGRSLRYTTVDGALIAHFIGERNLQDLTSELRQAIDADANKQARKNAGKE